MLLGHRLIDPPHLGRNLVDPVDAFSLAQHRDVLERVELAL
jgi:hypothetical protein